MMRLALSVAFAQCNFASLIGITNRLIQAVSGIRAQLSLGKTMIEPDAFGLQPREGNLELVEEMVIGALIVLAEHAKPLDIALLDWKEAAQSLPNQNEVIPFFAALERVLAMPGFDIARVQQDANELRVARSTAAVRMSIESNLPLVATFCGQGWLLDCVAQCSIRSEVEDSLGNLVRTQWLRRVGFAAEFLTPRLTVPAIQRVCNDGSRGLKLAARILLEAQFAVGIRMPTNMVAAWQKLAAD